ncbi:SCO family protein [Magnetospira thiophila]
MKRGLMTALAVCATWTMVQSAALAFSPFRNPDSSVDPEIFSIDEQNFLGVRPDPETRLIDQNGQSFPLKDLIGGKPLVLVLSYYMCDGTCSVVNKDLAQQLEGMDRLKPGQDFRILTLAFDQDDTLETLRNFRKQTGAAAAMDGWTWALFENRDDIKPFTDKLGFKFFWSPRDRIFFHPGVYVVISPDGRVSRYLYALNVGPSDVELALLDSATGTMKATPRELINFAVSLCYSYNYKEGRYTYNIPMFIAFGSLALGVGTFTAASISFVRRRKREATR